MDTNRLLGTLLGGVLTPPRRRTKHRRTPAPLIDVRIGGSRRAASALAALAGLAVEALAKAGQTAPTGSGPVPRPAPPTPPPAKPRAPASKASTCTNPWLSSGAPPPPQASDPIGAEDREALLVIRAMISAARADGFLDPDERSAIASQLDQCDLETEAREFVLREFNSPSSVEAIAHEVTDPVLAAQIYAACVLAVGDVSPTERAWLDRFAALTGLSAQTRRAIEERLAPG